MANDKAKSLNKSEAIRKGLSQHPDKGPTEIARLLTQQLGVNISPKHVSRMKAKERRRPGAMTSQQPAPAAALKMANTPPPTARVAAPAEGVAEVVTTLQGYIQSLGKEDLHRLIDAL
jgi:hypothetical protein